MGITYEELMTVTYEKPVFWQNKEIWHKLNIETKEKEDMWIEYYDKNIKQIEWKIAEIESQIDDLNLEKRDLEDKMEDLIKEKKKFNN